MKMTPVVDSVPKVNNELAVGADPDFQALWLKTEKIIWLVLLLFLIASLIGLFGRGPLAHAEAKASDGSFNVKYERVQRFGTPSVVTVEFEPQAIKNGHIELWVSDSLVKPLGNQRVVPQPAQSTLAHAGILYVFPAVGTPASVEFQTQPAKMGPANLEMRVPGLGTFNKSVFVMP